jgi:hypothetical protein
MYKIILLNISGGLLVSGLLGLFRWWVGINNGTEELKGINK